MESKSIVVRRRLERRTFAPGLSVAELHADALPDQLDPFLTLDHFHMSEPFFPPHPHAGFSAVTYIFPGSANGFLNRDSLGEQIEILPGDLHWTAAGSGVMHEETPIQRGVVCDGLQIFVNLHSSKKLAPPRALHLHAAQVPRIKTESADVRIVLGHHADQSSPLAPPTPVTLLDIQIEAGGRVEHRVPPGENRFVYVISGEALRAGDEAAGDLSAGDAAGFETAGDTVILEARGTRAHVILAGGRPLREPIVFRGPFGMSTAEDNERAVRAYQAGQMGRLEKSF